LILVSRPQNLRGREGDQEVPRRRTRKPNLSKAEAKKNLQWVKVVAAMMAIQDGKIVKIISAIPIQRSHSMRFQGHVVLRLVCALHLNISNCFYC
jgi:hypothetical protein